MFPILNGILLIIVYLAVNHFIIFSFQTNIIASGIFAIYFTIIYLSRNNQDLLQKMIDNMKKVK
jgi:hypothetical protein